MTRAFPQHQKQGCLGQGRWRGWNI